MININFGLVFPCNHCYFHIYLFVIRCRAYVVSYSTSGKIESNICYIEVLFLPIYNTFSDRLQKTPTFNIRYEIGFTVPSNIRWIFFLTAHVKVLIT